MDYMNTTDEKKMEIIKAMDTIVDFYDCTDTGSDGLKNWRHLVYVLTPLKHELFHSLSEDNQNKLLRKDDKEI